MARAQPRLQYAQAGDGGADLTVGGFGAKSWFGSRVVGLVQKTGQPTPRGGSWRASTRQANKTPRKRRTRLALRVRLASFLRGEIVACAVGPCG